MVERVRSARSDRLAADFALAASRDRGNIDRVDEAALDADELDIFDARHEPLAIALGRLMMASGEAEQGIRDVIQLTYVFGDQAYLLLVGESTDWLLEKMRIAWAVK